jgi:hypothetical protein
MDTKTTGFIALAGILAVAAFVGASVRGHSESSIAAPSQVGSAPGQANDASTLIAATAVVAQSVNEQLVNCTSTTIDERSIIGRMVACTPIN